VEPKTRKLFKELIKKITFEIMSEKEEEIEEMTSTANAPGYSTPAAFVGKNLKNKKKKNKKLKQSLDQVGYTLAEDFQHSIDILVQERNEEKYKPGDVWKRKGGEFAGKNASGSIQGYKHRASAEKWAAGGVPGPEDVDKPDKNDTPDTSSNKEEPKEEPKTEPSTDEPTDDGDVPGGEDNEDDDTESEEEEYERKEREELEKKANRGFFSSKWDDFSEKGALSLAKGAMDKGEKVAQDLEKGDAPVGTSDILSKGQDLERHKAAQKAAAKALVKKDIAKTKKDKAAQVKKEKEAAARAKKAKQKTKPKKKKNEIKEGLDNQDIKKVKKLIRQVVADILRDLWIKRSVWKDK